MLHSHISYLPLAALHNRFAVQDTATLGAIHASGQYIGGSFVTTFEKEFAAYCGTSYCIGTANGLDALTITLLADVQLGILPKNAKILVPAHTYIATFLSIIHAGLQPVPVDVEDIMLTSAVIQPHLGAIDGIVAVDIYGKMVDVNVYAFAKANNLPIYCDTAQSHGALNALGNRAGSLARASAFSFYPTKNLGALGDAGAITTNDVALEIMCRKIANYGRVTRDLNDVIGVNSRLDPLQAGFLSSRLKVLDSDNELRLAIASRFIAGFKNPKVRMPLPDFFLENATHVFPIFVDHKAAFIKHMKAYSIDTNCHYNLPPHKQTALKQFSDLHFPVTERNHNTQVSLPCHPLLDAASVSRIINAVNTY